MSQTLKMRRKKDRPHCICVHMSTLLLIFIHYGNVIGEQQESGELQVSYSIYKPEILG